MSTIRGIEQPLKPAPERFQTAPSTLFVDRFMTRFIKVGGIGIITVVFGIFAFILWQILPLFHGAEVEELRSVQLGPGEYKVLGMDEYSELPFTVAADGSLVFTDLVGKRGVISVDPKFPEQKRFTAFSYDPKRQDVVYGTADGHFSLVKVEYRSDFAEGQRIMQATADAGPFIPLGRPGHPLRQISYGDGGEYKLAAALQEVDGGIELHAASLVQEHTLFGAGEIAINKTYDLSAQTPPNLTHVLVNRQADGIIAASAEGEVLYFFRTGDEYVLRQRFKPFADLAETGSSEREFAHDSSGKKSQSGLTSAATVASMDFLFGDVTLVFTNPEGVNRLFSLYVPRGGHERLFAQTKEFASLESGATFYAPSLRNKAFLIGHNNRASLRYGTTENIRWEQTLPYQVKLARISGKYNALVFLDDANQLHFLRLNDPHPEASWRAMFGKIWYEGASEPKYEWQSTGGSDEFEPKLSLVPLIIGTLKGTLYAMLFSVPIALLAAIYTSQFAHPHFRVLVKPGMEIMASLPSVVLGFLAALWLAPVLEDRVPSILLIVIAVPATALLAGWIWSSLPIHLRARVKPGFEFVVFAPVFALVVYAGWNLGPFLEQFLFVVTDPTTGARLGDFRLWWPAFTGTDFQQRNSLVVGFAMGFAVIPIIFTITEDSLSNVPAALRSGSLALGASRWQTALWVVLPTASAGIFSALMIGLGRAVGETMIVVMATGNTPIMDFNIFSGMRTLSANIAVELPEAPHHSTLYRTLFLGAMVLFMMTFAVNTMAEILRQRLRERFKLT